MFHDKKILILCSQEYSKQPRVLRTILALEPEYSIVVSGYSSLNKHKVEFIPFSNPSDKKKIYWHFNKPFYIRLPISLCIRLLGKLKRLNTRYQIKRYWSLNMVDTLRRLRNVKPNLIICHGYDTLPLAVSLADAMVPVIFNAHEYYPLEFEEDKYWNVHTRPMVDAILKNYLPKCAMMFNVSDHIAEQYRHLCPLPSVTIVNAAPYLDLEVKSPGSSIKIVHHGAAMRGRQIERMAEMMNYLGDEFELIFMLTAVDKKYLDELILRYGRHSNISFREIVPVMDISREINQYDIGLFILPPVNFNWEFALPNKIFEFVQARLCLAVSPNPDMAELVSKYQLGVVSEDYSAAGMAKQILSLDVDQIMKYKNNSNRWALELSDEKNMKKIRSVVKELLD